MAHILVIDDDPDIRDTVRRTLESRGHTVEVADDGSRGIDALAARAPDLVITDVFMPRQDGVETLLELRKAFPRLRVIAMSGGSSSGLINLLEEMEMLGANQTIPKPFTPKELMKAVNEVLARPR
ncbi:MAG TPA: response regulator [Gemmatimonadales bacterium]|nr:response regulator [Gemmatimonadales bacterium]